ncbi:MAG: hypothetical protein AABX31_05480 [Nanoarchaeota archaeon]
MGSARKALLQILEESPNNRLDLTTIDRELSKRKVLGFGVEAKDVVYALEKAGNINYNRTEEMVYLISKPPLEVTDEMIKKWDRDAEVWAAELKEEQKRTGGKDLPPGFDPDDEHNYTFNPFKK